MNALAVILARAGSRGLPGKNTREIAGKPCISWTLDHVLASWSVGRVVVSTDCLQATTIAKTNGACVHSRPAPLATDTAGVQESLACAVQDYVSSQSQMRWHDDLPIVLLYANVPVRPADLTDRAVELFVRTGCDSVISVARVGKHHPWWTLRTNECGHVLPFEGDELYHGVYRRQDLPDAYVPDGGVTVMRLGALLDAARTDNAGPHAFLGTDRRCVTTEQGEVVDIDSPIDALVAQTILTNVSKGSQRRAA